MFTRMSTQTKNKTVAITGNTYPVKEQLKALGARWNGDLKAWMISGEKATEAQKIVAGAAIQVRNPNSNTPKKAPVASLWTGKAFQVRPKPCNKFAPVFGADTIEEIESWLEVNSEWTYSGTGITFQKRVLKGRYTEIEVCDIQRRSNGSGEYIIDGYFPASQSRVLCHRVTPGQEVGMGNS